MARPDLYISVDIEADGPVPGPYSMLSFGLAVAGRFDGTTFTPRDPEQQTFYRELRPISDRFDHQALRVARLDREHLTRNGMGPEQAMSQAAEWVTATAGAHRPVAVAFPLAFDWPFLHWYFVQFSTGGSPFSFSSCLDTRPRSGSAPAPCSIKPARTTCPASYAQRARTPTTRWMTPSSRPSCSRACGTGGADPGSGHDIVSGQIPVCRRSTSALGRDGAARPGERPALRIDGALRRGPSAHRPYLAIGAGEPVRPHSPVSDAPTRVGASLRAGSEKLTFSIATGRPRAAFSHSTRS